MNYSNLVTFLATSQHNFGTEKARVNITLIAI